MRPESAAGRAVALIRAGWLVPLQALQAPKLHYCKYELQRSDTAWRSGNGVRRQELAYSKLRHEGERS